MKAVTTIIGPAAPLLRDNVDTDLIIRIERISQLERGQLGPYLLETLRYRGDGPESGEREDFVLNQPAFRACAHDARREEFRLRQFARNGRLGAGGSGHSLRDRAIVRRYLL